jgi:hypothetical protein
MLRPAKKAPTQNAHQENPMTTLHYIGFDVHRKTISYCVKTEIVEEGKIAAQREVLRQWGVPVFLPKPSFHTCNSERLYLESWKDHAEL